MESHVLVRNIVFVVPSSESKKQTSDKGVRVANVKEKKIVLDEKLVR